MDLDPRLHFVAVTGIIVRRDESGEPKFLIVKRAPHEKAFPNKWTMPGGKLVRTEYEKLPNKFSHPQWYDIAEWVLRKEIREEVALEIEKPRYLTDLVFVRPDGYPVLTLSYWAPYKSGDVKLCKDLIDHAWVTVDEAKTHDLIDGIWEEIRDVGLLITRK